MRSRAARLSSPERRQRAIAGGLLFALALAFIAYSFVFVPRLTNNHFGDIEFSGWSGPIGSRLLDGQRPYVDFVLPIPPGSFALLAGLEWVFGRPLLMQELWLNALLHLGMGLLAYAIVVPLTSRKNALFVAAASLITVVQLNKECAYDHTAQILSWASFVPGVRALLSDDPEKRARLWVLTGILAASTLAFKQSTAVGAVLAWLVALAYLAGSELLSGHRAAARWHLDRMLSYTRGALYGLAFVWFVLLVLGSSAEAFYRAVFRDASALKGGTWLLVRNVGGYLLSYPSYPGSLAIICAFIMVGARLLGQHSTLHLGDEPRRTSEFSRGDLMTFVVVVLGGFSTAALLLEVGPPGYPTAWIREFDRFKQVPMLCLVFGSAFFVSHIVRLRNVKPGGTVLDDPPRVGHVFNAVMLASLTATILHNTSAPEFRPFYDNNPIIVIGFLAMFVALDRARLRWAQWVALTALMLGLFGNKYFRAMTATVPAPRDTHWAHLRLNDRGTTLVRAAERVRELASPRETVLVLPEDVQLAALIGRPRPELTGAILFVDQYAPHLAENDFARIAATPPRVIVVHPRRETDWQRFFRIWSGESGAEYVMRRVMTDLLPNMYELDSSYPTSFIYEPGQLDLYVRVDAPWETKMATAATRRESADAESNATPKERVGALCGVD